jgi:hypothetical protein
VPSVPAVNRSCKRCPSRGGSGRTVPCPKMTDRTFAAFAREKPYLAVRGSSGLPTSLARAFCGLRLVNHLVAGARRSEVRAQKQVAGGPAERRASSWRKLRQHPSMTRTRAVTAPSTCSLRREPPPTAPHGSAGRPKRPQPPLDTGARASESGHGSVHEQRRQSPLPYGQNSGTRTGRHRSARAVLRDRPSNLS